MLADRLDAHRGEQAVAAVRERNTEVRVPEAQREHGPDREDYNDERELAPHSHSGRKAVRTGFRLIEIVDRDGRGAGIDDRNLVIELFTNRLVDERAETLSGHRRNAIRQPLRHPGPRPPR